MLARSHVRAHGSLSPFSTPISGSVRRTCLWQHSCPTRSVRVLMGTLGRGPNMKPRSRKGSWRFVGLFVALGAALLVPVGGEAYAQTHGFSSRGLGHVGIGSGSFHRAAVRPRWGITQHGFAYGSGYGSYWSSSWGHNRFGYIPYGGGYSSGPWFYPYPPHPYSIYVYPRGHRSPYYVPGYHRSLFYSGWRFHH